ncbi:hypothetical protein NXC14_CH00970 [Rhizobium sp. NXC14]|nr:hypothetical protein NXC14_CH00970 [Rhizobium sp. NXC14]
MVWAVVPAFTAVTAKARRPATSMVVRRYESNQFPFVCFRKSRFLIKSVDYFSIAAIAPI